MTPIENLYKTLKFISDTSTLTEEQIKVLMPVLAEEASIREANRIKRLLDRSGLKPIKRLEDFDWKFNPKLPREELMRMVETLWEKEDRNFIMIGSTGVGKTHLAKATCYKAILRGVPAACITCDALIKKIKQSRNKNALLEYYSTVKLLCIDEIGYVFPKPEEADEIFQIISRRNELASTIITTNLRPSQWGKIFEPGTASAILDRLSLNGSYMTCEGPSYRSKKH